MNDLSALHIRFWDRPEDGGIGKERKGKARKGKIPLSVAIEWVLLRFLTS
jgi:hypothetical protein